MCLFGTKLRNSGRYSQESEVGIGANDEREKLDGMRSDYEDNAKQDVVLNDIDKMSNCGTFVQEY